MSIRWVQTGIVEVGSFCTAQGEWALDLAGSNYILSVYFYCDSRECRVFEIGLLVLELDSSSPHPPTSIIIFPAAL